MSNVGTIDRSLRFIVGLMLIVLPFVTSSLASWGNWRYALVAVGVVMLATAVFRFCPAYTLFGIRTCKLR